MVTDLRTDLRRRAERHAALGDPVRLAIIDELTVSDRTPTELGARLGVPSNLLAHHLDVLENAGLIVRTTSAGDRRRRYVRFEPSAWPEVVLGGSGAFGEVLFVCTRNSARSQLAAAMWTARTGRTARSAGTDPAPSVHRGAVAAARRAGLSLDDARPSSLGRIAPRTQVVTVCDMAHEELDPDGSWWHWSIPDPVPEGTAAAFDRAVAEIGRRISTVLDGRVS